MTDSTSLDCFVYESGREMTMDRVQNYNQTKQILARYLSFRDLPELIGKKYVLIGKKALDYGCGVGISSHFVQSQGFDVTGVDISLEMVNEAKKNHPTISFEHIAPPSTTIPYDNNTFDFIFSSFVLLEMATKDIMTGYLTEAKRVMKEETGIGIFVTASEYFYSKGWYGMKTDFPMNHQLKSGDLAQIYYDDVGIVFEDYFWTEDDHRMCFHAAGFEILEIVYPLGNRTDPHPWKDEYTFPQFAIYIVRIKKQ